MPEYEDDVEITSPPYPNVASRAPNLFKLVREFYDWLGEQSHQLVVDVDRHVDQFMSGEEEYRNAHDFQKFVKSALGKKPSCGTFAQWSQLGVVDHYNVWSTLRNLREAWDVVIRDHETEWRELRAFPCRLQVLVTAVHFAGDVFLTSEVREMRVEAEKAKREKLFNGIRQQISAILHKSGFSQLQINVNGETVNTDNDEPKTDDNTDDPANEIDDEDPKA